MNLIKMILIVTSLLIAFYAVKISAQEKEKKGIIKGKVFDADGKFPLMGVNVIVKETYAGTASDSNGVFEIKNLPVGNYSLIFSYIGYEKLTRTDVIVRSGRITILDVELNTGLLTLRDITVKSNYFAQIDGQPLSSVTFSAEEVRRSPGSAGDVSRILFGLPSLAKITDTKNSLIVRGGSPAENGFYLDNIEIPNINHFPVQGSSDGALGIINVDFVKDINFYSGGFSSLYGDKLSSIMELNFREGDRDKFDMQLEMSMQGIGASLEGPLGKNKGSYFISARRSYFDLLFKLVDFKGPSPAYSDYQSKLVYNLSDKQKLTILDVLSIDQSEQNRKQGYDYESSYYGKLDAVNNTGGINWQYLWNKDGVTNLSLSHIYNKYDAYTSETRTGYDINNNLSTEQEVKLRNTNHFRFNLNNKIDFGFEGKYLFYKYKQNYFPYTDRLGNKTPELIINNKYNSYKLGTFLGYTWVPFPKMVIAPGLRYDYFSFNKNSNISPRVTLTYNFNDITSINASYGIYYQNAPMILLGQNESFKKLKDLTSYHYILGLSHLLTENTKLTFEVYDKEYRSFPADPSQPYLFVMDQVVESGGFSNHEALTGGAKAYTRGAELMIQKKLAKDFYGLLSVSYFRAKYQDQKGVWRNRLYDNRFTFSFEGGYKPNNKWEFSARWIFAGGAPYTPFDEAASTALYRGVYDTSRINGSRLPDFHSLNLRVDRRFNFNNSNLIIYLSVWNAYGRQNVITYSWYELENRVKAETGWSTIPVFGVEWEL